MHTLGQQLGVLSSSVLLGLCVSELKGSEVSLALKSLRGNQTLDLGGFGVGLVALGDLTSDNKLTDIILLGQAKELSDVTGSLGSKSLGGRHVGESLNVVFTLFDNNKRQNSKVGTDNASSDRLSLPLTSSAGSVARVALGKEKSNSGGVEHTLFHGKTLLVVTSSDLEHVALKLVTKRVTLDLLAHSFLVEDTHTVLIIDLNELLGAVGGVSNIELKLAMESHRV
jgi:hypothetical protein